MHIDIHNGDCLDVLRGMEDNSIDAIVTDPPYGLSQTKPAQIAETLAAWAGGNTEHVPVGKGYMDQSWDGFVPSPAVWEECLRVLKPGGHMAVFAGSRAQDLMGISIRLAGFEIRDTLAWIQGGGFPRSLDYGNQLEKLGHDNLAKKFWDWRSEMKPANEPIIIGRKQLSEPSISKNIAEHGTGALNVGDCRYGDFQATSPKSHTGRAMLHGCHSMDHLRELASLGKKTPDGRDAAKTLSRAETMKERAALTPKSKHGRWPANVIIDEIVESQLGGNAKFFYCPRVSRNDIPKAYDADGNLIQHQTVKPLKLMEWLVTLITPPGGVVLDPFAGTGTTLQAALNKGFHPIGIEQSADYVKLIEQRLKESQPVIL